MIQRCLPLLCLAVYIITATVGTFVGGLWGGAAIGFAVLAYAGTCFAYRRLLHPTLDLTLLCLAALLVMACLNVISSQPTISFWQGVSLLTVFLPLLLLFTPEVAGLVYTPRFFEIIALAMGVGALALGLELYLGGPILKILRPTQELSAYNRGLSYAVLLALPIMGQLWISGRRAAALFFIVVLFVPTCFTESRAAKLCLVLALPVTYLAYLRPVLTRRGLAALTFLCMGWPFAARSLFLDHPNWLQHIPSSWRVRVEIWDYMSYRIAERPWLGWGLGTSYTLPFADPHSAAYTSAALFPAAHPHNVVTELWVELGVPGLVFGILLALLTLQKATRLDARLAPFAVGAWVIAVGLSLVAFDFWTDSLFGAFALAAFALTIKQDKSTASLDAA